MYHYRSSPPVDHGRSQHYKWRRWGTASIYLPVSVRHRAFVFGSIIRNLRKSPDHVNWKCSVHCILRWWRLCNNSEHTEQSVQPFKTDVHFTKATQLLVCRVFAGFGGSAAIAVYGGVLSDLWGLNERSKASGLIMMGMIFGPVFGPLIGGWVAERASWRWAYWVPVSLLDAKAIACEKSDIRLVGDRCCGHANRSPCMAQRNAHSGSPNEESSPLATKGAIDRVLLRRRHITAKAAAVTTALVFYTGYEARSALNVYRLLALVG
jgi:MFS family permease